MGMLVSEICKAKQCFAFFFFNVKRSSFKFQVKFDSKVLGGFEKIYPVE